MTRFLLACLLLVGTGSSLAQTFACQFVAAAGLKWEGGSWVTKTFKQHEPFFITVNSNGQGLTFDSAAKLLGVQHTCITDAEKVVTCMAVERGYSTLGMFLIFDPAAMKGGVSALLGATENKGKSRDSLYVTPFLCQKVN